VEEINGEWWKEETDEKFSKCVRKYRSKMTSNTGHWGIVQKKYI
jgi:hypothetical protein